MQILYILLFNPEQKLIKNTFPVGGRSVNKNVAMDPYVCWSILQYELVIQMWFLTLYVKQLSV